MKIRAGIEVVAQEAEAGAADDRGEHGGADAARATARSR